MHNISVTSETSRHEGSLAILRNTMRAKQWQHMLINMNNWGYTLPVRYNSLRQQQILLIYRYMQEQWKGKSSGLNYYQNQKGWQDKLLPSKMVSSNVVSHYSENTHFGSYCNKSCHAKCARYMWASVIVGSVSTCWSHAQGNMPLHHLGVPQLRIYQVSHYGGYRENNSNL